MSRSNICWYDLNGSKCFCNQCHGCRRKKQFTQHDAIEMAKRMNNSPNRRQARTKAYKCEFCDKWHVGHDNKLVPLWKQKGFKRG